jgi:nucleoside-diphosphate-sugar epimerase/predicted dehydrogenase
MDENGYRVGFVGTGYIAQYHARALHEVPGPRLVAVCDLDRSRADAFASANRVEAVFTTPEAMLAAGGLDVVHVLTPADRHAEAGHRVLESGAHLFLEKPMCPEPAECETLLAQADLAGLRVGVNHNFLFHPAYVKLREAIRGGMVGPLDRVAVTWAMELPQLRTGPFDLWLFRDPLHVLLELGSHIVAALLDLALVPGDMSVTAGDPVTLPGHQPFHRQWRISSACGSTAIDCYLAVGPGFAQRTIEARGALGLAVADLECNTCVVQRHGRWAQDWGKYERLAEASRALRRQARENLGRYVLGKLALASGGNPYLASITESIRAFYHGLRGTMDPRCSGQLGRQVVEGCRHAMRVAGAGGRTLAAVSRPAVRLCAGGGRLTAQAADVLVLGGTGFIGRELVGQLLGNGRRVRILTRRGVSPFGDGNPRLQAIRGDIRNEADLLHAMRGAPVVVHLARAAGGSWRDYFEQDVLGTERVGLCCLEAGVPRLVYASSIVGYNLGRRPTITEQTPFDPAVLRQNRYARAKAEAEQRLEKLHAQRGLPVVIVRPGMVIGRGGELCHGGVAAWNGLGSCAFWGNGRGLLPLVLVEDVARGLIAAMDAAAIEGQSFNLVDAPCLSAREYVDEIERFAGLSIRRFPTPLWRLYAIDLIKFAAKVALRMPDRYVPRYRMWKARDPRATFDCTRARETLNWRPAGDRDAIVARGIHVHLAESATRARPAEAQRSAASEPALVTVRTPSDEVPVLKRELGPGSDLSGFASS